MVLVLRGEQPGSVSTWHFCCKGALFFSVRCQEESERLGWDTEKYSFVVCGGQVVTERGLKSLSHARQVLCHRPNPAAQRECSTTSQLLLN